MKKTTNYLLAVAAIVALGSPVAQASIEMETVVVAASINPSTLPFDVPQFNPVLGTLTSVDLTLTPNIPDAGASIINISGSPALISFASVSGLSGSLVDSALGLNASWASTQTLQKNNFTAPVGLTDFSLPFSFSTTASGPLSVGTSGFVGGGDNDLSITVDPATATYAGSPSDSVIFYGGYESVGGTLGVTYNYTPAVSAVPEPTTIIAGASMMLPFGAGVLRILRKKLQAA